MKMFQFKHNIAFVYKIKTNQNKINKNSYNF